MCLGIPGRIVALADAARKLGIVDVCGVTREVNLACIVDERHPVESCVGEWVLVHVGFAMSRIDEKEAQATLALLTELGEAQAEIAALIPRGHAEIMPLEDKTLASLYPFLDGKRQDARELDRALLESVRQKSDESAEVKRRFFTESATEVVAAAHAIAAVYRGGGRLYTMGNGGSSCDAAHIAVEFQHPVTAGRPALPVIDLARDTAMITAVGNDVGFKHVFVRQVIAHVRKGDGLIGISTSGNAENLLAAFSAAKELGASTIALAGGDGGRMHGHRDVDRCLVVRSDSIHRVQETHVALYHILWDLTHTLLADDRGPAAAGGR